MTQFTVSGRFQTRDGWTPFETAVRGENEAVAEEHAYATLGSRHGLKRSQIEVSEVEPA